MYSWAFYRCIYGDFIDVVIGILWGFYRCIYGDFYRCIYGDFIAVFMGILAMYYRDVIDVFMGIKVPINTNSFLIIPARSFNLKIINYIK